MRIKKRLKIKKWKFKILIVLSVLAVVFAVFIIILENTIYPAAMELGEIEMKNRCMHIINDASDEAVKRLGTAEMIDAQKDSNGNIVMLSANSDYLNELNGLMVDIALRKLEEEMPKISIPLGTAMGFVVFSDTGPMIDIKTTCSGVAQADFESEFESTGINQSRFRMIILISIEMRMTLGLHTKTVLVDNQQLVGESIIIGKVPESWFDAGNLTP